MPDSLVPVRDRVSFSKLDEALPLPDLVGIQRESFDWLLAEGLKEVADRYPDLSLGSYPFSDPAGWATNLVVRGLDPARVAECMIALRTRLDLV